MAGHTTQDKAYKAIRERADELYNRLLDIKNKVPNSELKRNLKESIDTLRDEIDKLEERIP